MLDEAFDLANHTTLPDVSDAYLSTLNPEQREAVKTTDGPVLVLAGAGTGKTRVLTTRIAHILMQKKAFPGQILAVTFTNKAAGEMRERVESLLHQHPETIAASGLWLGTFHSIGAKILRRHAELLGFSPQFSILDADDQHRLIKQLMAESNIDHAKFPGKVVISIIQGWKDKGLTPDKIRHDGDYGAGGVAAAMYPIYQQRLKTLNAMDFGDLLLHCLTLFTTHQHILAEYSQRFRYILVDEYQDTNVGQYLWLRMLAMAHKNICCVGDDDQSIYGWRGAEVGNILKFEKDFPEAVVIRLERNYRSTPAILAAASHLIANNKSRLGKTLYTDQPSDHVPLRIKSVWDDAEEARFVGEEVEAYQRDKISLNNMAILVRAGFQTRAFEERFMTLGVAYKVVGGLRFYERMEIRDAVAYLRVIFQPHDDLALERIINTPKRGIGKSTMEQLHSHAREHNGSLYTAIERSLNYNPHPNPLPEGEGSARDARANGDDKPSPVGRGWAKGPGEGANAIIKGKTGVTLKSLLDDFNRWRTLADTTPLAELADLVLEQSGYRAMWQLDKSPESVGRIENLKELIRALGEFESLGHFLEHVGLVMDTPRNADGEPEAMVSIMTLHGSKGLEFDVVFLTGWEEGVFPSQRTLDESGTSGLEEERRLAYVGITRARKHCIISHAANRRMYNQWQSSLPSRFLQELPADQIEIMEGGVYSQRARGPAMFQKELDALIGERDSGFKQNKASAFITPPVSTAPAPYASGTAVFHQKFGNGVVMKVEGDHLTIAFKHAGTKKVMADYVEKA